MPLLRPLFNSTYKVKGSFDILHWVSKLVSTSIVVFLVITPHLVVCHVCQKGQVGVVPTRGLETFYRTR